MAYKGGVPVNSGFYPRNDFPIAEAKDIYVSDEKRLDVVLEELIKNSTNTDTEHTHDNLELYDTVTGSESIEIHAAMPQFPLEITLSSEVYSDLSYITVVLNGDTDSQQAVSNADGIIIGLNSEPSFTLSLQSDMDDFDPSQVIISCTYRLDFKRVLHDYILHVDIDGSDSESDDMDMVMVDETLSIPGAAADAKVVGDMKAQINVDIDAIETKVDANTSNITTLQGRIDSVDGNITAINEDVGNVDNLATTNKVLVDAINEVRNSISAGGVSAAVTITSAATTDGMLKSYTIKQGENVVGVIDIPKDMVVESGEVVTLTDGQVTGCTAGTYIKLVLTNVVEPLYINVGTLVDIYKVKADATQVQVAINPISREISATIVAGSVTTTELADNSITTTKIADKNVTKLKLSVEVQASLDKADVAEANAKAYVDGLNTDMNARMNAVEGKIVNVEGDITNLQDVDAGIVERVAVVEARLGDGDSSITDLIADVKSELQEEIAIAIDDAKTNATNKDIVILAEVQKSISAVQTTIATKIDIPESAEVGQVLSVKNIDADGNITWETINMGISDNLETTPEDIIEWMSEENAITPVASSSGQVYLTNDNKILIL